MPISFSNDGLHWESRYSVVLRPDKKITIIKTYLCAFENIIERHPINSNIAYINQKGFIHNLEPSCN